MGFSPEPPTQPRDNEEAKSINWPVCLCTRPPQIMKEVGPDCFQCLNCASVHDRRQILSRSTDQHFNASTPEAA
jgi:hypothetical protein